MNNAVIKNVFLISYFFEEGAPWPQRHKYLGFMTSHTMALGLALMLPQCKK